MTNFNYQEPEVYSRMYDEIEKGPYEVPPVRTKTDKNKYLVLISCRFCSEKSACVLCLLSSVFYFVGDKMLMIALKIKLHHQYKQSTGLNLINMWQWIMKERKETAMQTMFLHF